MKPEQEEDAEDNGCEENLTDAVVEDLLIGIRGVAEVILFLSRCFRGDWMGRSGCVLFYVHVPNSLGCNTGLSLCRAKICSWGVPLFSRGKGVYNIGSPLIQGGSCKALRFF
jgi:hypothetical protein